MLSSIDDPSALRGLSDESLVEIANDLRQHLIDLGSSIGGHFAGSLGTVELTVALHTVFDTPNDRIVWDVGHQAY
jgi:1-deoxy-D-xylulose-5-phosphate synthase